MNWLDIIIAIPLAYLIYKGYRRGIIFEVAALAGIIVGTFLAVRCANWFANLIGLQGEFSILIAFFVVFVGVIILSRLLGRLLEQLVRLVHAGILNNIAGALLGLLKGLCIVGVFLYFVSIADPHEKVLSRTTKESSMLYLPTTHVGTTLTGHLHDYVASRRSHSNS